MPAAPTLDEAAKEYAKCKLDVSYFIDNYCMIKDENTGSVGPFKTFDYQKGLLEEWQTYRLNVDLKARQLGISWLACGFALWLLNFYDTITILCISKTQDKAYDLVAKVRFMYQLLPAFLKKDVVKDNLGSLVFKGDVVSEGSRIIGIPSTPGSAVGYTATLIIVDEWGEQDYAEELYTAYKPTIDMGGRMIGIGTGNQVGSFYHEIWTQARAGLNGFHAHFLHWSLRPGRDQDWYDRTRASYPNPVEFMRQYPNNEVEAFVAAGGCPFNLEDIEWYMENCVQEPKKWEYLEDLAWPEELVQAAKFGELLVWEKPQVGHQYTIAFDGAAGIEGRDYHAFHVIKTTNMEQVAEYRSRTDIDKAVQVACQMGRLYDLAVMIPESTGVGAAVVNQLVRQNYPNIYEHEPIEEDRGARRRTFGKQERQRKLGWPASRQSNHLRDADIIAAIRDHELIIHSARWFDEAKGFVRQTDGTYGASGRAHDDLVTAMGMGYHVTLRLLHRKRPSTRPIRTMKKRKFSREKWR